MLQAEHIEIEATGPGCYRLRWSEQDCTAPQQIHPSSQPDTVAMLAGRVVIGAGEAEIVDLPAAARHFFHLHWGDGVRLVVADRHVPLQGARNFRDFGGYTTLDGGRVRWGCLYRSGQLGKLTELDQQRVAQLGIRLICDFRRDTERADDPSRLALEHRPRIENLPIAPGNTANVFGHFDATATSEQVAQIMVAINRDLALQQRDCYRRMFDAMLAEGGPLLVHCAVGKDRTGFAAALILAVLGVPEQTIMRDYLLTTRYLPAAQEVERILERNSSRLGPELLLPLLEAREVYLQAALGAIREHYGHMDVYLREFLGIDDSTRRELRARLVVD